MVCGAVANQVKTVRSKGEPNAVWFAMLIRKDKYNFNPQIQDVGVYWEYELNPHYYYFILKYGCRDDDEGTRQANKVEK